MIIDPEAGVSIAHKQLRYERDPLGLQYAQLALLFSKALLYSSLRMSCCFKPPRTNVSPYFQTQMLLPLSSLPRSSLFHHSLYISSNNSVHWP